MKVKKVIAGVAALAIAVMTPQIYTEGKTLFAEEASAIADEEYAQAVSADSDYEYTERGDGTIWIKSYSGSARELIIPEMIDGKEVTCLGSFESYGTDAAPGSFFTSVDGTDCENNCTVSITIPNTVTDIRYGIFHNGLALTEINVAEGNRSYMSKDGVLYDDDKTQIITYPAGKTDSSFIVPDTVRSINNWAFMNSKIKTITLPDNMVRIDEGAFSNCSYLQSINIPTKLTALSTCVFKNCISLKNIIIPNNISKIEIRAFSGCSALAEVTIPQNIEKIQMETFMDCTSLVTVNLPESLHEIEKKAFFNCSSLVNITMPDRLKKIGLSAFDNCTSLTEINIPASLLDIRGMYYTIDDKNSVSTNNFYIGYFNGCTSLKDINVAEENERYKDIDGVLYLRDYSINFNHIFLQGMVLLKYPAGKSQTKFNVPDEVIDISYHAFSDCVNLKSIILPDKLKYIHTTAFIGCTSLTSLVFPMITDVYSDTQLDIYFYFGENFENSSIDTIYGFIGSPVEDFAKKYYNFVGLNSPSLIDEETKIILEGNSDNPLNDIIFNVVKESALSTDTSETYDITLKDTSGNFIQPTKEVVVKIPLPTSWNASNCNVYRKETNNRYTDMRAVYSDGYMVFTTDHFSEYTVTSEKLVPDAVLGDVNGDQAVNDQDSILLSRYLAGWGNEIDTAAADINGDGSVNDQDSIILSRTLAGWYD